MAGQPRMASRASPAERHFRKTLRTGGHMAEMSGDSSSMHSCAIALGITQSFRKWSTACGPTASRCSSMKGCPRPATSSRQDRGRAGALARARAWLISDAFGSDCGQWEARQVPVSRSAEQGAPLGSPAARRRPIKGCLAQFLYTNCLSNSLRTAQPTGTDFSTYDKN